MLSVTIRANKKNGKAYILKSYFIFMFQIYSPNGVLMLKKPALICIFLRLILLEVQMTCNTA